MFIQNNGYLIFVLLVDKQIADVSGQIVDESTVVQLVYQDMVVSGLHSGIDLFLGED